MWSWRRSSWSSRAQIFGVDPQPLARSARGGHAPGSPTSSRGETATPRLWVARPAQHVAWGAQLLEHGRVLGYLTAGLRSTACQESARQCVQTISRQPDRKSHEHARCPCWGPCTSADTVRNRPGGTPELERGTPSLGAPALRRPRSPATEGRPASP